MSTITGSNHARVGGVGKKEKRKEKEKEGREGGRNKRQRKRKMERGWKGGKDGGRLTLKCSFYRLPVDIA